MYIFFKMFIYILHNALFLPIQEEEVELEAALNCTFVDAIKMEDEVNCTLEISNKGISYAFNLVIDILSTGLVINDDGNFNKKIDVLPIPAGNVLNSRIIKRLCQDVYFLFRAALDISYGVIVMIIFPLRCAC